VTKPKDVGGLGLRNISDMNFARLLKLGWELQSGKNSLWCSVMYAWKV
jgi:hypothetical protein